MSSVVIDGITIGHPCCGVHNCKEPLQSQSHRFCATHIGHNTVCSILECQSPAVSGSRACSDPTHQSVEAEYRAAGKARRQLRERLQKAREACAALSGTKVPDQDFESTEELDADPAAQVFLMDASGNVSYEEGGSTQRAGRPGQGEGERSQNDGKKRLRAQFGRKRTHNEQIIIAPCGVIIARTTFYGAEAIGSVVVECPFH